MRKLLPLCACCLVIFNNCARVPDYDVIIRHGLIVDGTGNKSYVADLGIRADTIAAIGDLSGASGKVELDATGKAVAPGFINMLSQSDESLIADGRSQSDIRQGVTLEVMGEGVSMGPLNPRLKQQLQDGQTDIRYTVAWNTLGGYLDYLQHKGVSCNVASFVGAAQVRNYVIGEDNRAPTPAELDSMKVLVDRAMQEGAMGVSTALIYPPGFFAKTDELVALAKEASKYHGMYISHMRSEGDQLFAGVDELLRIAREADIPAEIFHLKAAGKDNWWKEDSLIHKIDSARSAGLQITADMYMYTAGATGMTAAFPPDLQDGGFGKLRERLMNPATRARMGRAMDAPGKGWENLYYGAGGPSRVLFLSFKQDSLKKYTGKTLAQVAAIRGTSPEQTAMDLIVEDSTRIEVAYFLMSEENVVKEVRQPWVSFCSDEGSMTNSGVFLKSNAHPRAYGTFARVLGTYVRQDKALSLEQAVHQLAGLPATNLKLERRGFLKLGDYADVVVFDPATITDHATYDKPHQYATGVSDVFVNGVAVLRSGTHTGAFPGRFVKGPGAR